MNTSTAEPLTLLINIIEHFNKKGNEQPTSLSVVKNPFPVTILC